MTALLQNTIVSLFLLRVLVIGATLWALWHSRELIQQPLDIPLVTEPVTLANSTDSDTPPMFQEQRIDNAGRASVHSASMAEMADGRIRALWFAGSREGASDVAIYTSVLNKQSWNTPSILMQRQDVAQQLGRHISKLGNPVIFADSSARLWLFLVSVSVGGWAGSAINTTWSDDNGENWQPFSRLSASPFMNLGSLVRTTPIERSDGGMLLPAYHESIDNFAQILTLNQQGRLLASQRIDGERALQPSLCRGDGNTLYALLRHSVDNNEHSRVLISQSEDSGQQWQTSHPTDLENPNASVVCLRTNSGQWLLVGNRSTLDRSRLSLAVSNNPAEKWYWLYDFENQAGQRYSYPAFIQDKQGRFHLLYSWNRSYIKHLSFNQSWLDSIETSHSLH